MVPEIAAEAPIIGILLAGMRGEMQGLRRRRPVTAKNAMKAQRAEASRHCAPERQQPDRIDAEVRPIGMDQRIGDEGPYFGAKTAGQRTIEHNR